jgi:hypothetical protein
VEAARQPAAPQGDLFDAGFQTEAAGESAVARLVDDRAGTAVQLTTCGHTLPERRARWRPLDAGQVALTFRRPACIGSVPQHAEASSDPGRRMAIVPQPRQQEGARALGKGRSLAVPTPEAFPADVLASEPLALRLLPEPRRVAVTTRRRRGYAVPVRYRERLRDGARARHGMPLLDVLTAAGPDRVAVGHESGAPIAREYWQCLTGDGQLVLLFRNAAAGGGDDGRDVGDAWYLHGWWD